MAVYCPNCHIYTVTVEPILIRKQDFNKYHIRGLCKDCKWTKSMYLSNTMIHKLPQSFQNLRLKYNFMNYVFIDGKMEELYPILNPILNPMSSISTHETN